MPAHEEDASPVLRRPSSAQWLESTGPTEETPLVESAGIDRKDGVAKGTASFALPRAWIPIFTSIIPVEVVAFNYFFGMVMCLPLTQFYLFDKVAEQYGNVTQSSDNPCGEVTNSSESSLLKKVQAEASNYTTFLVFASSFPGIIQTFIFGALSDRYGRKGSMLMAIIGSLIRQVIYLIIFQLNLPLGYLFIGNAIEGLSGSFGTMLTAVFGAVADITPPGSKRAFRMALLQACLALASATATVISGFWIKLAGFKQPIYFITALSIFNFLFVVFLLPETNRNLPREPATFKTHLKSLKTGVQFYTKDTENKRRWKLTVSLVTFFTSFSVDLARATILTLFLLNEPFCWNTVHITVYSASRSVIDWVCILLLTKTCGRYISDVNIAIIGCVSNFLGLILIGFSYNDAMLYAAVAIGIFSEVAPPMMRAVMSRLVSPDEQGALFASVSGMEMLTTAVFGVAATQVYKASLSFFPGLVFVIIAGLILITAFLLGSLSHGMKKDATREATVIAVEPE